MSANPPSQRFASRFGETPDVTQVEDSDCDDLGAFALLRGSSERAEMLELRRKTGNIRAIPYGWISKIDFDPSTGITLYVGEDKIQIRGRWLNRTGAQRDSLLRGICRHRVPWISESDQSGVLTAEKETIVIEKIEW
jgi:hypothetical protein